VSGPKPQLVERLKLHDRTSKTNEQLILPNNSTVDTSIADTNLLMTTSKRRTSTPNIVTSINSNSNDMWHTGPISSSQVTNHSSKVPLLSSNGKNMLSNDSSKQMMMETVQVIS